MNFRQKFYRFLLWGILAFNGAAYSQEPLSPWWFGLSTGLLSGYGGIAVRYWQNDWGLQATALPLLAYEREQHNLDGFWSASVQGMRPFAHLQSLRHEPGGYTQSISYTFAALSAVHTPHTGTYAFGGGLGCETHWRRWRFASAVGIALLGYHDRHAESIHYFVAPTLELSLGAGI